MKVYCYTANYNSLTPVRLSFDFKELEKELLYDVGRHLEKELKSTDDIRDGEDYINTLVNISKFVTDGYISVTIYAPNDNYTIDWTIQSVIVTGKK